MGKGDRRLVSGPWELSAVLKCPGHCTGFYGPIGDMRMGGIYGGKRSSGCVIVSLTNSTNRIRYRVRPIAIRMARKMCACNTAQALGLRPRSSWQGAFPAPLHPPARGFQPLDPTIGASPSGLPTGAISSPGPMIRRAFVPALDPQTEGDFAPPTPCPLRPQAKTCWPRRPAIGHHHVEQRRRQPNVGSRLRAGKPARWQVRR